MTHTNVKHTISTGVWRNHPTTPNIAGRPRYENCVGTEGTMDTPWTKTVKKLDRLPGLQETQRLRECAAEIDFEQTIVDMFEVIQSMESQLSHVLNVNTLMERELVGAKERISNLKQQRDQLQEELGRMKEEMPSKRELQMVVDQLLEERNDAEQQLRNFKRLTKQTTKTLQQKEERITELASERKDFIAEIHFLETRLTTALDKDRQIGERLIVLEGQTMTDRERIQELERDLQLAIEEKFKAAQTLRESRRAMTDLNMRFKEAQVQAHTAFATNKKDDT
ncbi:hypothetical protein DSUL_150110 [Desulfovibrionales bacterium]